MKCSDVARCEGEDGRRGKEERADLWARVAESWPGLAKPVTAACLS
jgi:hypothetical protein